MHRYRQIEVRCGAALEVIKCHPRGMRKGVGREPVQKSPEEIQKANMKQAAKRLARLINANFRPGDVHVTLTYRKENRPDPQEAQKNLEDFRKAMRKKYRKAGKELRWIAVTEYKSKAIHHHMIINNINDGVFTTMDYIRELWKGRGSPKFVQLYDDAEYTQLADYLIKETEKTFRDPDSPVKQRYSCSRNLAQPKVTRKDKKIKGDWEQEPKPREGYYIVKDSLYNGVDKLGYPYQSYIMVKLDPKEEDWPSNELKPIRRRRKCVHRKC